MKKKPKPKRARPTMQAAAPQPEDGIDLFIDDDGNVKLHVPCKPGEDPGAKLDPKLRSLLDSLGVDVSLRPKRARKRGG